MDRSSFNDRTTKSHDFFERKMQDLIGSNLNNHQRPSLTIFDSVSLCKYRVSFTAVINTVGHGKLTRLEF